MQFFVNMRISAKILLAIGLLGALSISVATFGSFQLTRMAGTTARLINDDAESLKLAGAANQKLARLHQLWLERVIETDAANLPTIRTEIASARAELGNKLEEFKPLLDGEDLSDFRDIENRLAQYDAMMAPVDRLLSSGDRAGAEDRAQDKGGDIYDSMDKTFNALVERQDSDLDKGAADAATDSHSTSWWLLVSSVLGLLVVGGVTLLLVRRTITGPLGDMVSRMGQLAQGRNDIDVPSTGRRDEVGNIAKAVLVFREAAVAKQQGDDAKKLADAEQQLVVETLESGLGKLAKGDLTASITAEFSASYVTVKTNFNEALGSLRALIGTVLESSATIRTGSSEIAQASEDLARRTEANAASLEETSAAVTQMDGRLRATAESAGRTVKRADDAIATVAGGRSIADEAVQAMTRVSESAKGIDGVIEGLDKIAFQTRVLAMNAAVEAGRAGEAGRGFAVVADLVSALAMRAEEEAGRARDQLTATQTDIVSAVEMVQKVDGALSNISGDVGEVHALLNQMAADNQAQSTAITQISVAVGTMDQSTQQNAAMVEETSAAARNLNSEVLSLSEQASKFNVGNQAGGAGTYSPARPARSKAAPAAYHSPVKALPVTALAGGSGSKDDWASF